MQNKGGQYVLRAVRPNGTIATTVVEDDDILRLLAAKLASKEKARLLELDKKLGLDKVYPVAFGK